MERLFLTNVFVCLHFISGGPKEVVVQPLSKILKPLVSSLMLPKQEICHNAKIRVKKSVILTFRIALLMVRFDLFGLL